MSLRNWLRAFSHPTRRTLRHRVAKTTSVELLEDRSTPTVLTWDGGGALDNFNDALNWDNAGLDQLPAAGDTLVFTGLAVASINNDLGAGPFALDFTAGGYTITGGSITLNQVATGTAFGIRNSAGTNVVNTPLTLGAAVNTFTVSAGQLTFANAASGGAGNALTKDGAGTLTLTGTNLYTGATSVADGTLQIGNGTGVGALAAASAISVTGGKTLRYSHNNAQTISNPISGAGNVVFQGTGVINQGDYNIAGTNTSFTGSMSVTGARVQINATADVGTASLSASSGGQYLINGGTYTNAFSISGNGWLEGSYPTGLGALRILGNATLSGTVTLTGNARIGEHSGEAGFVSGLITDGGGGFVLNKFGPGTLTLNRTAGANTYSGGTTVDGGVLSLGTGGTGADTSHVGALGSGMVTVNAGGQVRLWIRNNATFTISSNFTMNGGTLHDEDGNYTMNGTISVPVTSTFSARYTGKDLTISSAISGAGGVTINNVNGNNGGAVIFSNAGNSYAGVTTISASTLQVPTTGNGGGNSTLGASSNAAANLVFNGGTLRYVGAAPGSTDRLFTLNTAGGTIQSTSGTAANTLTFTNTGAIAYGGAGARTLTLGGGNTGNNTFNPLLADSGGPTALQKSDAGKWRLTNAGAGYTGVTTVNAGTLEVTANGALGGAAGATIVASGGTLAFDGTFNYSTAEPITISGIGVGGAGAISKTTGSTTLSTPITMASNATIGSGVGATLTINPNIVAVGTLNFTGAGNIVMAGNVTAPPALSLGNLNAFATGDYSFTAASQTFNARVDNVNGTSWLLIGRGREGWQFDTDGQGLVADVNQNLGTPAAFAPALYSDAIVNDLLVQSGINPIGVEVRLRRAANPTGTAWQEARWRNFTNTSWTSVFSNPGVDGAAASIGGLPATLELHASALNGAQVYAGVQTRDAGDNDGRRVFTWGWSGHAGQRGFSYGSAVNLVTGPSATNFLWESGGENHEIPYTEIYVRALAGGPGNVLKNGTGTLTLQGPANTYTGTTTVNGGVLVVANSSSLGTAAGGTAVTPGGTLSLPGGLNIPGEALSISGIGAAGMPGALVNAAGNNSLGGNIVAIDATIASVAGDLTLSGNVNTVFSNLAFAGAGNIAVNGAISESALPLNGVTGDMELWLDASDVNGDNIANNPADGSLISAWIDKSGKGHEFDNVLGDPNLVAVGTHLQPAVNFDGNDALRTNLADNNPRNFIDGNGEFTIISVARYSGADRERVIAAVSGHNWLFGFHGASSNNNGHYDGWGSQNPGPVGASNDTNWHVHANQMNVFSDATNPAGDWWRDGVRLTNDSRGTGDTFNNNVPDGLSLGAWSGLSETSTADVSELLMYNRVLSDSELNRVQAYLNAKYSLGFAVPTFSSPSNITKNGAGTLTFAGANTYSGNTTINGGVLKVGANEVIPHGAGKGNVFVNGATLDVNGFVETINGFTGNATAVVDNTGAGAGTLIFGANDQTSTYAGVIQDTAGNVSLEKVGTGTQTFSGVLSNTYQGTMTVSAGTLLVTGGDNLSNVSAGTTVGFAGTLSLGANEATAALTLQTGTADGADVLLAGNALTLLGDVSVVVAGTGAVGAAITGVAPTSSLNLNAAAPRTFTVADGAASDDLTITTDVTNGAVTKSGPGTMTYAGAQANTYAGATVVTDGTLSLDKTDNVTSIAGPGGVTIGNGAGGAASAVLRVDSDEQIVDTVLITLAGADGQLFVTSGNTETILPITADFAGGDVRVAGELITTGAYVQGPGTPGTTTLAGGTIRVLTTGLGNYDLNNGTLQGTGTVFVTKLTNAATIDPGIAATSAGQITIRGNLDILASGAVNLNVGGLSLPDFDQLNVLNNPGITPAPINVTNGTVQFRGTLNTGRIGSYVPTNLDFWDVMNFETRMLDTLAVNHLRLPSDFATKNLGPDGAGRYYDPRFLSATNQLNAESYNSTTFGTLGNPPLSVGLAKKLRLTALSALASDVTASTTLTKGGFTSNSTIRHQYQFVTVKNTTGVAIDGPIYLEIPSVSVVGVKLYNRAGLTMSGGKEYVVVSPTGLAAGASVTVQLDWLNPMMSAFTYTHRVLAGGLP